jgi:hypothetical protein
MPTPEGGTTPPEADAISLKRSLTLFTTWLKDHKYTTTASVEIEGQKGSREASGIELMFQALIAGATFAAGSLVDAVKEYNKSGLLPGDTLGRHPDLIQSVDPETGQDIFVPNPVAGQTFIIPGTLRSLYTSIGNAISTSNANFAANPTQDIVSATDTGGLRLNPVQVQVDKVDVGLTNISATNIKADAGGLWKSAVDKYNAFTDALSGVTVGTNGYTLGDAFNAAKGYVTDPKSSFNSAVSSITGIKQFTVSDFAGSLTDKTLITKLDDSVKAYTDALNDPTITPAELALKEAEVDDAAQALSNQVDQDNANYLAHLSQQSAIDDIAKSASQYNEAPDEYKELYASTLSNPGIAVGLSDNIDVGKQLQSDATQIT